MVNFPPQLFFFSHIQTDKKDPSLASVTRFDFALIILLCGETDTLKQKTTLTTLHEPKRKLERWCLQLLVTKQWKSSQQKCTIPLIRNTARLCFVLQTPKCMQSARYMIVFIKLHVIFWYIQSGGGSLSSRIVHLHQWHYYWVWNN